MNILNSLNVLLIKTVYASDADVIPPSTTERVDLKWQIPSLADIVSFALRFLFIIAGLIALIYLVLGAFAWVTSSGNKENVSKAQEKIQAAIVGLVVMVAVIVIVGALEQFAFNKNLCLGLTCAIKLPSLIQTTPVPAP